MPSDDALIQQAEDWKKQGNESFSKSKFPDAIKAYSQGVVQLDRLPGGINPTTLSLKLALLSNRAACYLKLDDFQNSVDDCTVALDLLQNSKTATTDADMKVRGKLLFRRAKAQFCLASMPGGIPQDLLNDAAKDLLQLLSFDANNKDASSLLKNVRTMHAMAVKSNTPVAKTLDKIRQNEGNETERAHQLKVLLGLLDNDNSTSSMELGRRGGVNYLFDLVHNSESAQIRSFALKCLSCAGSHPPFIRAYGEGFQQKVLQILKDDAKNAGEEAETEEKHKLSIPALALFLRLVLHLDRDDPEEPVSTATKIDSKAVVELCRTVFSRYNDTSVLRAVLEVLSVWTAGKERDTIIRAALADSGVTGTDGVNIPKTKLEKDCMPPKEFAQYRQRVADLNKRDETWAYERARRFCSEGGLEEMLKRISSLENHSVRREMVVTLGRSLAAIESEDKIKKMIKPFIESANKYSSKDEPGVIIEEIYNEDGEEDKEEEVEEQKAATLQEIMGRCAITTSLLIAKQEVGTWCLMGAWDDALDEVEQMINSGENAAMCMASELCAAGTAAKECRVMMHNFLDEAMVEKIMASDDRDVRSGVASAVAKLGLGESSATDEGEVVGLLQTAADLLEQEDEDDNKDTAKKDKKETDKKVAKLADPNAFANPSICRGIEMITYLVSQTQAKEEITAGFSAHAHSQQSCLERLVDVCAMPNAGASLSGFGLATIFHHLAVTAQQLRKEMFHDKEFTMEQYDEIQRMGKTQEEKDLLDKTDKPDDSDAACAARIRMMANKNVARALVNLTENASEGTLEQVVQCMLRMADEQSVRGMMIQQGALTTLIKIEKDDERTNKLMKKIIREARHCIAKLLVTIDPSLLTSAQRMGSIKPLVQLIRDVDAFDFPRFEALLSITNLGAAGEDTKNRIAAEKGISTLHFAMFSDDEDIRRAATEAMSNMIPHKSIMDYLKDTENLRLWLAFAADFEENYGCSRAACGGLAMAVFDPEVATAMVSLKNFEREMTTIVQSGQMELTHRSMVLIKNLVEHGGKCVEACKAASLVSFCRLYVENFHDGMKAEECEFTQEELALMPTTIELAKKVVLACD